VSDPNTLGGLIRERRLAQGLSLGQLATAVGRTAATVRAWERGQHFPAADVVDRLAITLGLEASQIEDLMYQEPPSLTVVADELTESTSVGAEASVETAEGQGSDDAPEIGQIESAPVAAADSGVAFTAASADELGVMPKIEVPSAADDDAHEPVDTGEAELETTFTVDGEAVPDADAASEDVAADEGPSEVWIDADAIDEDMFDDAAETAWSSESDEAAPAAATVDADRALLDEPTEAIGPPIVPPEAAAVGHVGVAVRAETLREPELPPFLAPLRALFDPGKKWLYWVRGSLTVVAMFVMFLVLTWAAGELFDGLGEILDTIDSDSAISSGLG